MPVVQVKTPPWSKEPSNPTSPTPEIRDPGKRPLTGVDEIRSTIEFCWEIKDVGVHPLSTRTKQLGLSRSQG